MIKLVILNFVINFSPIIFNTLKRLYTIIRKKYKQYQWRKYKKQQQEIMKPLEEAHKIVVDERQSLANSLSWIINYHDGDEEGEGEASHSESASETSN